MLRVPPSEELRMFANQLMKDFGYKDIKNSLEIILKVSFYLDEEELIAH